MTLPGWAQLRQAVTLDDGQRWDSRLAAGFHPALGEVLGKRLILAVGSGLGSPDSAISHLTPHRAPGQEDQQHTAAAHRDALVFPAHLQLSISNQLSPHSTWGLSAGPGGATAAEWPQMFPQVTVPVTAEPQIIDTQ